MAFEPGKLMTKLYGLVILLVVLQAVAIGLVIRFAADRMERDHTLLERTGAMMEEVFPGIRKDLSEVSKSTTAIKSGISGLRTQVSQVDQHVGRVGQNVVHVGSRLDGMNKNLTGFVEDRSGIIWGHSLNPYLLIALLAAVAASVPVCVWYFGKKRGSAVPQQEAVPDSPMESFSLQLNKLSDLVHKIGNNNGTTEKPSPELERLMMETERLIRQARMEVGDFPSPTTIDPGNDEIGPAKLH